MDWIAVKLEQRNYSRNMDIRTFNIEYNILNKSTEITDIDPDKTGTLKFYPIQNTIFIPNYTLTEYFNREESNDFGNKAKRVAQELLINNGLLKENKLINEASLIVFYLLHEEGHYIHCKNNFLSRHLTGRDYLNQYYDQLEKIIRNRDDLGEDNEDAKLYREHPFEKIADAYAVKQAKSKKHLLELF